MKGISKILLICLFLGSSVWLIQHYLFVDATLETASVETLDREYYFELYDIEVIRHPTIESAYPEWFEPDITESVTNVDDRIDILPFEEDKKRNGYVVYPKHGMVVPLSTPSTQDAEKIHTWVMFDHYPYLDRWALHYRGNNPSEGFGNMVVAAHSSYIKDAPGNYKTVFQVLPISRAWDKIFVYLKNDQGWYDLYTYVITDSFRTDMTDISVLSQTREEKFLTTYGCYIIWDNSERRVNHAILESVTKNSQDLARRWSMAPSPNIQDVEQKNTETPTSLTPQEHWSPSLNTELPLWKTENPPVKINQLDEISSWIPAHLLPTLKQLVVAIIDRLEKEPELYNRVHNRLLEKIRPFESKVIEDPATLKVISIYRYIHHYVELIKK
jgi:hypothetical protein